MKRLVNSTALVAVFLLAGTVLAEDRKPVVNDKVPTDQQFVAKALAANTTEIQLANKAKDKASNDRIRTFAQEMIQDHTRLRQELMNLVKNEKIAVVTGEKLQSRQLLLQLTQASGGQFDRLYMDHMVNAHQKAVNLFENYAEHGKNPQLKAYAQKALPTLRKHLKHAQEIDGSLKK
jgi:putative membrane protein